MRGDLIPVSAINSCASLTMSGMMSVNLTAAEVRRKKIGLPFPSLAK
jgi:hypothetical protein